MLSNVLTEQLVVFDSPRIFSDKTLRNKRGERVVTFKLIHLIN